MKELKLIHRPAAFWTNTEWNRLQNISNFISGGSSPSNCIPPHGRQETEVRAPPSSPLLTPPDLQHVSLSTSELRERATQQKFPQREKAAKSSQELSESDTILQPCELRSSSSSQCWCSWRRGDGGAAAAAAENHLSFQPMTEPELPAAPPPHQCCSPEGRRGLSELSFIFNY